MRTRVLLILAGVTLLTMATQSAGARTPTCHGRPATIVGTPGNDNGFDRPRIVGTEGPDVIMGLGGSDAIDGLGGDDWICGGGGADGTYVPNGTDYAELNGGPGVDRIWGGPGNDEINGNSAAGGPPDGSGDFLYGGPGNDRVCDVFCYQTEYSFSLEPGDDMVFGGRGDDHLVDAQGDDLVSGGPGDDTLSTEWDVDENPIPSGADTYIGGPGNDDFRVDDSIGGNDFVNGRADFDTCFMDPGDVHRNCESFEHPWR